MTVRIVTGANGIKYITNEPFKPNYNTEAVLVEEMQRMAKRIEELEAMLDRQTARIVDLQCARGKDANKVFTRQRIKIHD